ncbi:MAG: hypothetical protein ACI30N_03295 [Muribaculaceae bacterium]
MNALAKALFAFFAISVAAATSDAKSTKSSRTTDRTPAEVYAADTMHRVFDSPFGISNLPYCSFMDYDAVYVHDAEKERRGVFNKDSVESIHQLIFANGYTKDKGYSIAYKRDKPDPYGYESTSRGLEISLPPDYKFPLKDLHPAKAVIWRTPDSVRVEFSFVGKDNKQSVADRFRKLFKTMKAMRDEEASSEKYDYYGQKEYTITESADTTKVACLFSRNLTWSNIPAGYFPAWGWTNLPANGPYNKGSESFDSFLKRFNTDGKFRMDRTCKSDYSDHQIRLKNLFADIAPFYQMIVKAAEECGLYPLQGRAIKNLKEKEFDNYNVVGQWVFPTADKIIYSGWDNRKCDEYDSNAIMLMFERLDDGKWYCTAATFFGSMMEAAVRKQMY